MNILHFYIIITPKSLNFLKFAIWSLQRRIDFEITLVSNGLSIEEYSELILFTSQIQCSYKKLHTSQVLKHGVALNLLIKEHEKTWFCFCDSDIISTNPQSNNIPLDANIKALSACDAMFWDTSPVKGVLGRCNRWPDGSQNLSSFFCIYHTQTIKKIMEKYTIGFENIVINDIQSKAILRRLQKKGITEKIHKMDTAKALTVAIELENYTYKHIEIPSFLHIGGLSSWILNGNKELVHSHYHLTDNDLNQLAEKGSWLYNPKTEYDKDNALFYLRRQQRLSAARYCFQLISHYIDKTPKPSHTLTNSDFNIKIDKIVLALNQYLRDFP